ncbi:MAG: hypothetical protein KKG99_06350 [Bacteroidetes bacterium]|nr:hypothetical protein [Bacteroidota bacterium]
MEFWKKFFNQPPTLWGWALLLAVAIGIFIDVAPTKFILVNNTPLSDHQWTSDGFFYDVATQYAVFTSYVQEELGRSVSVRYSRSLRWIITIALLSAVVVFTKKSNSALFIAGPLVVFLVAAGIIINGLHPENNIDFVQMIFYGAIWYGVIGLGVMYLFIFLTKTQAIRGIDEDGPVDFSGLKAVTLTTAGQVVKVAGGIGNNLQAAIGESDPSKLVTTSAPQVVASATQPSFKHRFCVQCGTTPVNNGKCRNCQTLVRNAISTDKICSDCGAEKMLQAKHCYNCGLLFENEPSSYRDWNPSRTCNVCDGSCKPDDKFCEHCGTELPIAKN